MTATRRVVQAGVAAVMSATLVLAAAPASADSTAELDALDAAVHATAAAMAGGVDVVQTLKFSQSTRLTEFRPRVYARVPAGSRVRVHATVGADGTSYFSVRYQPSGRLIAGAGVDPSTSAPWATLLMLFPDARARARAAGLADRTALTDVSPDDLLDSSTVRAPVAVAADLLLPPYADAYDEGWTTIRVLPQADGTTIIRGSIRAGVPASDGEDRCTRPLVELTVGPDNVARSSRWTQTCPGQGTVTVRATAVYGSQDVQPPTRPQRAASSVLG